MQNNFLNYYKPRLVIILIAFLGIVLYLAKSHLSLSIAISAFIVTFLILLSKYLWNRKPFKWLFWVEDFSGRYEGILRYSYVDEDGVKQSGERKHVKIINQNGSRISVASFTFQENGEKSSPSSNKGMFVEQTQDENHYNLIYPYLNEGNPGLNFPPHYGTDVIKFIKKGDGKVLSGRYYTDRDPQTRGEYINLRWVSNNLNHDF